MLIFDNVIDELNDFFYGQGGYKGFPVDLIEIENGFKVVAEMPGVLKEDIKIEFEDGILTIEADRRKNENEKYLINERLTTHLKRKINLGDINEDTITAKLDNGLLTIAILTKIIEERPRKNIVIE